MYVEDYGKLKLNYLYTVDIEGGGGGMICLIIFIALKKMIKCDIYS